MQEDNSNNQVWKTSLKFGIPLIAIGIGAYFLRKKLRKRKNKNPDGTSTKVAPSLKETKVDKSNLTITPSDAALFANTLYGAMMNWGTDEQTIYNTINKLKTRDDMLLLIKAFGTKQYMYGGRAALIGQNINLLGWLRAELSKSELKPISDKCKECNIPI